ncbi:hypothetical protein NCR96_09190 [Helicobacter sp. 14348-15]|uniref:hypothetical protein n=1 Tax=Helicobacter colisuis TaxID=2949739 RepID=UPI00202AD4DE|nr:hypothetical protein [Helicobacter colisuis]MCL9821908.1 hypothetical protein [Helicobacter colisuis]
MFFGSSTIQIDVNGSKMEYSNKVVLNFPNCSETPQNLPQDCVGKECAFVVTDTCIAEHNWKTRSEASFLRGGITQEQITGYAQYRKNGSVVKKTFKAIVNAVGIIFHNYNNGSAGAAYGWYGSFHKAVVEVYYN